MSAGKLGQTQLPLVRRLEAASFRAWPSTISQYDGTWLTRLTAGHNSKRINSVTPLDYGDNQKIAARINKAKKKFEDFGRALVFRQTPLCPNELIEYFDAEGWLEIAPTQVMTLKLSEALVESASEQLPWRDVGTWIENNLALRDRSLDLKPGLSEIIELIKPQKALFLTKDSQDQPLGTTMCVQDGNLAGLFEVAINSQKRCKGHGKKIVLSSLHWAFKNGAREAWLHVEDDNHSATSLYEALGFKEVYRSIYRIPPK